MSGTEMDRVLEGRQWKLCPECDKERNQSRYLDNMGRCGACSYGWGYSMEKFKTTSGAELKAQSDELNTGISAIQPSHRMVGGDRNIETVDQLKAALPIKDMVNHPAHYGGADDPYEVIKVIEAWKLNFNLGNAVKYIGRLGKKAGDNQIEALGKAVWYLQREIENLKNEQKGRS